MISVQRAIFPGILIGSLVLVMISKMIALPGLTLTVSAHAISTAADLAQNSGLTSANQDDMQAQLDPKAQEANSAAELETSSQTVPNYPEDGSVECSLNAGYPDSIRRWCDLIERYANEHGVDANLIAAVMLQESGGNPDAYSKSGAVGLMQVMPRDGLASSFVCVNGPCFASRPSMDELFVPEFNVSFGVRMLAGLINRYGSVREALRAYGPMNMGYRYADIVLNIMDQHQ